MGSGQSHKKIDQSRSRLLHLYYNNKVGNSGHPSLKPWLLMTLVDGLIHLLPFQRTILHRALPTFIFVTDAIAFTSPVR